MGSSGLQIDSTESDNNATTTASAVVTLAGVLGTTVHTRSATARVRHDGAASLLFLQEVPQFRHERISFTED